jgi:hypothetical protein
MPAMSSERMSAHLSKYALRMKFGCVAPQPIVEGWEIQRVRNSKRDSPAVVSTELRIASKSRRAPPASSINVEQRSARTPAASTCCLRISELLPARVARSRHCRVDRGQQARARFEVNTFRADDPIAVHRVPQVFRSIQPDAIDQGSPLSLDSRRLIGELRKESVLI